MRSFGPITSALFVAGFLASTVAHGALAADSRALQLNKNAFGLLASETHLMPDALEIADALHHDDGLRIMPIVGAGAVQAIVDLAFLQSVDAALIPSDTIAYARLQGLTDGIDNKISYVARLAQIELVLVARKEFANVTALAGKRIATGPAQSAAFASGELLFNMLEVPFLRVPRQGSAALQALARGQADAALVTSADLADAKLDARALHVLALPVPAALSDVYSPAILTSDDVPTLLMPKQSVDTVSVSLAVAVFNWPRNSEHYAKLRRFSSALYAAGDDISSGGRAVNLSAAILGWPRHASADEALSRPATGTPEPDPTLQQGDGL